jgi:nucleotide-binding universal stress UspA family protein
MPAIEAKQYKQASEKRAQDVLTRVKKEADAAHVACTTSFVTSDSPWSAIVDAARDRKCDLIVMASHGRRGLSGLLLGSETNKVLTHSKTPVLVCR